MDERRTVVRLQSERLLQCCSPFTTLRVRVSESRRFKALQCILQHRMTYMSTVATSICL